MQPPPILLDNAARSAMTASCRDCERVPKVQNAGCVVEQHGERLQIMHNGILIAADCYYGSWMTNLIASLGGHHEPQEEVVFHEVMKSVSPNATMIELGGYWSYYSLWFMQGADARRSIVVEPDPRHLEAGRRNAELNNRKIEFVQACVGRTTKALTEFQTETSGLARIRQITVEMFMEERGVSYLDVLHCDTQGAETDVIASCENLFTERRVGFCLFSTHSHHISGDPLTHQKCLHMIKSFGGRVLAEHDVHESFSGDGLIAAYFGPTPIEWTEPKISLNRYSTSLFRNPLYDLAQDRGQL